MQLAAAIAVVVSVVVFAFQARELARQSRLANELAGTHSHGEIIRHWKQVLDVFIQYPELRAHYFDQTSETPSASDVVRLRVIAEQHADWLEVLLVTTNQLAAHEYSWMTSAWADYIPRTVASSSLLRSTIRDQAEWPSRAVRRPPRGLRATIRSGGEARVNRLRPEARTLVRG